MKRDKKKLRGVYWGSILDIKKENMASNIKLYPKKDFLKEINLNKFFSNNLSLIFPTLTLLSREWSIPFHKESVEAERKIDALAFFSSDSKKKMERLVIIEYKWGDQSRNPLDWVARYSSILTDNEGNCLSIQQEYDKHSKNKRRKMYNLGLADPNNWKAFCKKNILICIAPPNFYHLHDKKTAKEKRHHFSRNPKIRK